MKEFDAAAAQQTASVWTRTYGGETFRHYKGDYYTVVAACVDEATGEVRVVYESMTKKVPLTGTPFRWSRTLADFNAEVSPGEPRFRHMEP